MSKLKPQNDSDALDREPSDKLKPDRCQFTFSDGRQCRMQQAQLCVHHASKAERECGAKGAPDAALGGLEALCGDLTTATNINRALTQVFLLMAQGRISQKQAVAFGYRPWQEKLAIRLGSTSRANNGSEGSLPDQRASPEPPPLNKVEPERRGSGEPSPSGLAAAVRAPSPDYASLLSRSSDLFDGKYDTTPEGRREANALVSEVELLQPPASKPPKGTRASASGGESHHPPRKGYPLAAKVYQQDELSPPNKDALFAGNKAPIRPGSASRATNRSEGSLTSPAPSRATPVPGTTLGRTGHTTDWFVPASWSKTGRPDSFPNRVDKSARELRSMSNYRLRHLQHLNSRGF